MYSSPPPVASSLLNPHILLSALFSNILSIRSSTLWGTRFHTHT
jgi:hypothetical protein